MLSSTVSHCQWRASMSRCLRVLLQLKNLLWSFMVEILKTNWPAMARRGSPLPAVTELIRNQLCRRPETVWESGGGWSILWRFCVSAKWAVERRRCKNCENRHTSTSPLQHLSLSPSTLMLSTSTFPSPSLLSFTVVELLWCSLKLDLDHSACYFAQVVGAMWPAVCRGGGGDTSRELHCWNSDLWPLM